MRKPRKTVIVSDLDNTLFDWFEIWYGGFRAMLTALVKALSVPEELLLPEIKEIHEQHGTSEYPFVPEELPLFRKKYGGSKFAAKCESIRREFLQGRAKAMHLYPAVRETLVFAKKRGCLLVAYTESMGFYSNYRLRKLGLDELLDFVYSPPDHKLPAISSAELELYTKHNTQLQSTIARHTPGGELKPNPTVLRQIVSDLHAELSDCVYVGDDLMKDITMAKDAGITDAWAKYGVASNRPEYDLLRKVTHWPQTSVIRQQALSVQSVSPTYTLLSSFGEIRQIFDLGAFQITAQAVSPQSSCCAK